MCRDRSGEFVSQPFEIKWCKEHDQFVAGMNDHCGCEFSEGCWFDNSSVRYGETTTPCRIVSKIVSDKEEEK